MDSASLAILHDHYKESFSNIREREKQRDRLFLILIGILGLLFLEIHYPANLQKCVKEVGATGVTFYINAFSISIITSATWTSFLTLIFRYCQSSITVERQYDYIHKLEDAISSQLGDGSIYRREGHAYNLNYPVFSKWVYIFYVYLFTIIVIGLQVHLILTEYKSTLGYFIAYDAIMAAGVLLSLVLYRGAQVIKTFCKKKYKMR